jgi:hypothetical protein
MNCSFRIWSWVSRLTVICVLLSALGTRVLAAEMKLEAQLIWGTNDEKSPDPSHKPLQGRVLEKLERLPLKWKHYFEVARKEFSVKPTESKRVAMSKDCEIEVRNPEKTTLEVRLFGKNEEVGRITQPLPKEKLLVIGGNAENFTGWLVVLRQVD